MRSRDQATMSSSLTFPRLASLSTTTALTVSPRRGETVKAMVVLKEASRGKVTQDDIVAWSRERMAAYKVPRVVEFVATLPKSATGKIQWRQLQEAENRKLAC